MTTKDEALKLALEALEEIHPGNMTPMAEEAWDTAITALREALAQKDVQALHAGAAVPSEALSLSGDAKLAHDQCRAVVRLANSFAEIYAARAAIVEHDARLADLIGEASAYAMGWLGDELNAMDATSEEDVLLDPIFEAAQERWPQPPKRKPLTDAEIKAALLAHFPNDAEPDGSYSLLDYEREITRAIERAHGIGADYERR